MAAPVSRPITATHVVLQPANQSVEDAKVSLMTFFNTDYFVALAGNRHDFKDALKLLMGNKPAQTDLLTIFSTLIQDAEEAGYLDQSIGKLFFGENFDQGSFALDVAKKMVAIVETDEKVNGIPVPPSKEDEAYAKTKLLEFLTSDAFRGAIISKSDEVVNSIETLRELLDNIKERSKGNEATAFLVDEKSSPGYFKFFSSLIRENANAGLLDKKVGEVFFAPKFDSLQFTREIIQEVLKTKPSGADYRILDTSKKV